MLNQTSVKLRGKQVVAGNIKGSFRNNQSKRNSFVFQYKSQVVTTNCSKSPLFVQKLIQMMKRCFYQNRNFFDKKTLIFQGDLLFTGQCELNFTDFKNSKQDLSHLNFRAQNGQNSLNCGQLSRCQTLLFNTFEFFLKKS